MGRKADTADKRKAWLDVTDAGRELLAGLEGVSRQYYEVATSDWTPEERVAAGALMARLQDSLLRLQFDADGRAAGVRPTSIPHPPEQMTVSPPP